MDLKLRMFHVANAPMADGFRRKELLLLSDEDFENKLGFIQWAFPTTEPSKHLSNAPVLDLGSAIWLAKNHEVSEFLESMTVRFLEFLKSNPHWKCKYNHNHLRISRAIQSIRILHSWELASWFYNKVKELAGISLSQMENSNRYWAYYASPIHDRIAGAFVGLAIGDALGAPVEFLPRGTFDTVTSYGAGEHFKLPAGAWTDDTAMAICLAQNIIENDGLAIDDLLNKFCDWAEHGSNTSTGVAVGIGQNTLRVLGDYRRNGYLEALPFGSKNDGNGSLMRLAPIACHAYSDVELARSLASNQSKATHASRPAEQSCQLLAEILCMLISGHDMNSAIKASTQRDWGQAVRSILSRNLANESSEDVTASGYVIEMLHAALWSVNNSKDFKSATLKAVNLGDDANTVGAIAGQIAGAIYGYSSIPKDLKTGLINERELYVTSQLIARSSKI